MYLLFKMMIFQLPLFRRRLRRKRSWAPASCWIEWRPCWVKGTSSWTVGSPRVVGTLEPASCSKGGAQVVWLQAVTSLKNPWKKSPAGCKNSSRQVFLRVADILKTSWLVVYPVVYDLFYTSFLVMIEMPMIPVLRSTRDSWILGQ